MDRALESLGTLTSIDSSSNLTALERVEETIAKHRVTIFSKSYCPYCNQVKKLFNDLDVVFFALELDLLGGEGVKIQEALYAKTQQKSVPNVFIRGHHVGGCDSTIKAYHDGRLINMLEGTSVVYDYDLVVIGGGSGGLAASKEAAVLGRKVAVCDFVVPTPIGTTWGLGGTCVNVGCIPKKLMHRAALVGTTIKEGNLYGWLVPGEVKHDWTVMVQEIQQYIKSLNWGYRVALKDKGVTYLNSLAEIIDPHRIRTTNKKGQVTDITARHIIIAVGGRPMYPNIPGAKEFGITSDDIFSLMESPGKTLLVGASYIALECAGFLAGLGIDVTVMVRSILLRGFDQQMANMIGEHMEAHGVKFIRECVPTAVELSPEPDEPDEETGSVKTGSVDTGSIRTGSVKSGSIGTGSVKSGSIGTGSVKEGSIRTGSVKEGSIRTGSVKEGSIRTGSVKGGSVGSGSVKEGSVGTGSVQEGSVKDGSAEAEMQDAEMVDAEVTETEMADTEMAEAESVETEMVEAEMAVTEPVETEVGEATLVKSLSAEAKASKSSSIEAKASKSSSIKAKSGKSDSGEAMSGAPESASSVQQVKEEWHRYKVTGKYRDESEYIGKFNTVVFAIGREACTKNLGLVSAEVRYDKKNGKIIANEKEQTSAKNIYAIGDVLSGKPELTPVAIQAGKLLAKRLYNNEDRLMDYLNIPTTVFTPLEYGCVGYSEEAAIEKYGADNIEVYHSYFQPLEYGLPGKDPNSCYAKLICVRSEGELVVGFHYLGPDAGEVTQGFAIGIKLKAKKCDFGDLVGIHPTCAEVFTSMSVTKASGESVNKTGC